MSNEDQNHAEPSPNEQLFVERALAGVERAERVQRIKQIVASVFLIGAALWLAFRPSSSELNIECTVIIFVGLIAATCTTKILSRMNQNTKDILQAISNRQ
jgi:hypothetical protein